MTSVVPEASVVSHRSAKPERAVRPTGMRSESGGFSALMDEAQPEPKHSANQTRSRDRANPAEKSQPASGANAPASPSTPQASNTTSNGPASAPAEPGAADDAAPASILTATSWADLTQQAGDVAPATVDGALAETLAADAEAIAEPTIPETPDAAPIAATVIPAADPAAALAVAIDTSAQPDPAAAVPAEAAASPSPSAAEAVEAAAAPAMESIADTANPAAANTQAAAQSAIAGPAIKAAATTAAGDGGDDTVDAAEPLLTGADMADTEATPSPADAPKQPKPIAAPAEPSSQASPARQEAAPDKPDLRPDAAIRPDDPAPTTRPAIDPTAQTIQLGTPAPGHVAVGQAATQQAMPVTAAQPVPVDAIAVEIASQARAGNSRFEIRLDPPELGRIDVRLDIDNDGNVKSRLVIERSDTYDLLRRDQSTLERALQQAGLKTSDNSLEFSLRDQGFAQQRDADDHPRGTRAMIHDAEVAPSEAANGYARLLGARGGIDIRV